MTEAQNERLAFATLTAVVLGSVLIPPFREAPFTLCLFRLMLGHPCPGCGMTRAFIFLGHGRPIDAFHSNPMSLLAYPLTLALWLKCLRRFLKNRPFASREGG